MRYGYLILIIMIMTSFSDACTSPAGVAGQLKWIAADNKIKWCNGSTWIDTTNAVVASCAGTASGTIRYASNEMRYCNGTNWMSMQGASGTTSGGVQAGRLAFDSTVGKYKFCNGSSCYVMETAAGFNEINTPFGGLGLTDVNSLTDVTYSGGTITSSRISPYQAKTLTLSGSITYAASAAVFIRAKTLVLNSATIHANGFAGGNSSGSCTSGGRGGSGGGAGDRTGGSGTNGGTNGGCGGGTGTGATYNTGFTYGNGGAAGTGGESVINSSGCGYYTSAGAAAGLAGNAYGGGGGGGGSDGYNGAGGGGGSGGLVVIIAETISGTATLQSRGGSGGGGFSTDYLCNGWPDGTRSTGGGGGGGGGIIWVAAKSKMGILSTSVSGGAGGNVAEPTAVGGVGSTGTVKLFQINTDGSLTIRNWTDTW